MENQVTSTSTNFKTPTETIDLPSKGLLYPKDNPLSSGKIELRYMSAVEEDILTNRNYINKGIVFDKLMQSLIVTPINYNDLITGDLDALMIAARVLGYGKNYQFKYLGEDINIDLSKLENKKFDESLITPGVNEFKYTLPNTGTEITFKILTRDDERKIQEEIDGLKKLSKELSPEISTRLKYIITSVGGDRSIKTIREFIDKRQLLASDSRELRNYIKKIQPGVDQTFFPQGSDKPITIPLGLDLFWPDSE